MNAWAIVESCTLITKGEGHFDFDTLMDQLIQFMGPNGLEAFPRPMGDITGDHLTGVEADAVYEAIYQGLVDPQVAAIVHAGPQPGQEEVYAQALRTAINAGAPYINQAVEVQNQIWEQKRNEELLRGKPGDKIPMAIPPPFEGDLGNMILSQPWREGVWGPMKKDTPWQYDEYGVPRLRIGNRDQENKFSESWNRPYHEGLKAIRPDHVKETSESIAADKVRPNSVYVSHEASKHAFDLMDQLAAQGYHQGNLTPDILKQAWMNHPVLRNYGPQQSRPIQHIYNIRSRDQAAVAESPDVAQQAVEQQQAPVIPQPGGEQQFGNYWPEEALQNAKGKNLAELARYNWRFYGPKLLEAMGAHHDMTELDMDQILAMGQGSNRVDRLFSGMANHLNQQQPGFVPPHVQDPAQVARPQPQPQPQPQAQQPQPQPQAPPQPPVPQQQQAPPVPRQQPAPPVPRQNPDPQPPPVGQVPPNNPPEESDIHLNANEVRPNPVARLDGPPQFREGWRGMLDRLGYATGSGVGSVANFLSKEEIENALESVQCEIARQDSSIIKALPHTPMSQNRASDMSLMASKIQRPVSDVVAILNSRGDWQEMAKAMDIPLDCIQLVKVAFK